LSSATLWQLSDLLLAVKQVWASLFSAEATNYRMNRQRAALDQECGIVANGAPLSMAVIVQHLVQAAASGTVFNSDVRTGHAGILIEGVKGQGELQAQGGVKPDCWLFDPQGKRLLEIQAGAQPIKLVISQSGTAYTKKKIEPDERYQTCLSQQQAQGLASTVTRIAAQQAQGEQKIDCEFATTELSKHHFLQLRPQTAIFEDDLDPIVTALTMDRDTPLPNLLELRAGGETASLGAANGRLVIVAKSNARYPEGDNLPIAKEYLEPGDILVTATTNIGWTPLFGQLAGVVAERGGVMSHTALIARERNIPAIVGAYGLIERIQKTFSGTPGIFKQADGAVWILPKATLDANNMRLFNQKLTVEPMRLRNALAPDVRQDTAAYYEHRIEFPHFEVDGIQWTGKPEYKMTPLQFALYYRGWERAYEILNLSHDDMPLAVSVALPSSKDNANSFVGTIRLNTDNLISPDEYHVVAFPTEKLAALGDRIRHNGISGRYHNCDNVLDQIMAYNEDRKRAFAEFEQFMAQTKNCPNPCDINFKKLFELYSEIISYAHVRAAFRRRVAGPLRSEAIQSLPDEVRPLCEKLLLLAARGVPMETDHVRDVRFTEVLLEICEVTGLRQELLNLSWAKAERLLCSKYPHIYMALIEHAADFKILRGQSDHWKLNWGIAVYAKSP
jgi:phosphohistidine swiveling domain-containing protein